MKEVVVGCRTPPSFGARERVELRDFCPAAVRVQMASGAFGGVVRPETPPPLLSFSIVRDTSIRGGADPGSQPRR